MREHVKLGWLVTGLVSVSAAGFACSNSSGGGGGGGGTGSSSGAGSSSGSSSGGGTVITLASHQEATGAGSSGLDAIAVDSTSVYFASANRAIQPPPLTGFIAKVPLAGGTVTTLVSAIDPRYMTIDSTHVYWTDASAIYKVPLAGGSVTTLATEQGAASLVVDATDVYFVTNQYSTVEKVPIGGGSLSTLYTGSGYEAGIAVNATDVYWTENAIKNGVYNYTVNRVPLAGGTHTALTTGSGSPNAPIAIDRANVYFPWTDDSNPDGGVAAAILAVPLAGGTPTTLASGVGVNHVAALAIDSSTLYYGNDGNASLVSVPIAGGTAVTLNNSQPFLSAVAVDSTDVYWTCPYTNAVLKLAK